MVLAGLIIRHRAAVFVFRESVSKSRMLSFWKFSTFTCLCLFGLSTTISAQVGIDSLFKKCFPDTANNSNSNYPIPAKDEDMYTFTLVATPMTHTQAESNCRAMGGNLNSHDTPYLQRTMKTFVDKECPGLNKNGQYIWVDELNAIPSKTSFEKVTLIYILNLTTAYLPSLCRFDRPCFPNNKTEPRFQVSTSSRNESYKIFVDQKLTYTDAASFCRSNGGDIAIVTPEVRQAMSSFLNSTMTCANRKVPDFLWMEQPVCLAYSFAKRTRTSKDCYESASFACVLSTAFNVTGKKDGNYLSTCSFKGSHYVLVKKQLTNKNAIQYCQHLGGALSSFYSSDKGVEFWKLTKKECPALEGFDESWAGTDPWCYGIASPKSKIGYNHMHCDQKYPFVCKL